jgi:hypothetical protein
MSKARAKGTVGENFFLARLRLLFGPQVERAPLKGIQDRGDYTGVPWLHEAKNTAKPLFQAWARVCRAKAGNAWTLLWKGDMRKDDGQPLVLMPLPMYEALVITARAGVAAGAWPVNVLVEMREP